MNICTNCRHPWEPSSPDQRCPDCGASQGADGTAPADPFAATPADADVDGRFSPDEMPTTAAEGPPPLPPAGASWDPATPNPGTTSDAPHWTPAPTVGATRSGMSTGAKIAIGVGIGFIVLVGVAFIAGVTLFRSVAGSEDFQAIINEATSSGGGVTVDYPLGTCFNHGDLAGPVPCSEPHSHEVFALTPWADDAYPDYEEVWTTVFCDEPFQDYVGIEYFESKLFYDVAVPSATAWESGDHDIRCIAYEPGSDLTESIRNAAY